MDVTSCVDVLPKTILRFPKLSVRRSASAIGLPSRPASMPSASSISRIRTLCRRRLRGEALYGPNGLFPDVRMADVPRVLGRTVWRKSRWKTFRREYVKRDEVERVRQQIRKVKREIAELVG